MGGRVGLGVGNSVGSSVGVGVFGIVGDREGSSLGSDSSALVAPVATRNTNAPQSRFARMVVSFVGRSRRSLSFFFSFSLARYLSLEELSRLPAHFLKLIGVFGTLPNAAPK